MRCPAHEQKRDKGRSERLITGVLLATMGLYCLWWLPVDTPLRPVYLMLSLACSSIGLLYGAWTLLTQSRLTTSPLPLVACAAGIYAVGRWMDRVKRWRIVAVGLLALVPLQFGIFLMDYFTAYRTRSAPWSSLTARCAGPPSSS